MAEGGKKFFKYGCFGCLGAVILLILIVVSLAVTAMVRVRNEKVEDHVLTREIPAAGRVILSISHGECYIKPADPGEPLRVEACFDTESYELKEELVDDDASGWTYRVDFLQTNSTLVTPFAIFMGGSRPDIRVYIPRDVPLSLDVTLSEGGHRAELGGLWLTSAEFDLSMGGFDLRCRKPLHEPMEKLSIHSSMGGFECRRLGNASPEILDVCLSMGGMDLDLRGDWVQDSHISIRSSMAGGDVRLPKYVVIEGLDNNRFGIQDKTDRNLPVLTFSISSDLGELHLRD